MYGLYFIEFRVLYDKATILKYNIPEAQYFDLLIPQSDS